MTYSVFGVNLDRDVSQNSSEVFDKLGLSNSMAANIPLAVFT